MSLYELKHHSHLTSIEKSIFWLKFFVSGPGGWRSNLRLPDQSFQQLAIPLTLEIEALGVSCSGVPEQVSGPEKT